MYPFIFISITLHLISFFCIVLLFLKKRVNSDDKKELELSMNQYIEKLEEENNRLLTHVNSLINNRSKEIETRLNNLENIQDSKVERQNPVIIQHPSVHNERNQKAVQLYQQGFSVADIARILNCGIGEVELIVNLHGRSEQR